MLAGYLFCIGLLFVVICGFIIVFALGVYWLASFVDGFRYVDWFVMAESVLLIVLILDSLLVLCICGLCSFV